MNVIWNQKYYSVRCSNVQRDKKRKAVGCDELNTEICKTLGTKGVMSLTTFLHKIYNTRVWSEDFLKVIMVPMKKKSHAKSGKNYRTINLLLYTLTNITRRLQKGFNEQTGEKHFGFMNGKEIRYNRLNILERLIEFNK